MSEKKITKKMVFEAIKDMVTSDEMVIGTIDGIEITSADVAVVMESELKSIQARRDRDAEKRAEKSAALDDLTNDILEQLCSEWVTGEELVDSLGQPDITKGMVVNRLSKLVKEGKVEKGMVKVEGADRKKTVYKLV